jgi:hypothetical protein
MERTIWLCIPTRERHEQVLRMTTGAVATAKHPERIHALYGCDQDDPDIFKTWGTTPPARGTLVVGDKGERGNPGDWWRALSLWPDIKA